MDDADRVGEEPNWDVPNHTDAIEIEGAVPQLHLFRRRVGFIVGEVGQVAVVDLLRDGVIGGNEHVFKKTWFRG